MGNRHDISDEDDRKLLESFESASSELGHALREAVAALNRGIVAVLGLGLVGLYLAALRVFSPETLQARLWLGAFVLAAFLVLLALLLLGQRMRSSRMHRSIKAVLGSETANRLADIRSIDAPSANAMLLASKQVVNGAASRLGASREHPEATTLKTNTVTTYLQHLTPRQHQGYWYERANFEMYANCVTALFQEAWRRAPLSRQNHELAVEIYTWLGLDLERWFNLVARIRTIASPELVFTTKDWEQYKHDQIEIKEQAATDEPHPIRFHRFVDKEDLAKHESLYILNPMQAPLTVAAAKAERDRLTGIELSDGIGKMLNSVDDTFEGEVYLLGTPDPTTSANSGWRAPDGWERAVPYFVSQYHTRPVTGQLVTSGTGVFLYECARLRSIDGVLTDGLIVKHGSEYAGLGYLENNKTGDTGIVFLPFERCRELVERLTDLVVS